MCIYTYVEQGSTPNGVALLSTSSGDDISGKKKSVKQEQTTAITKGDVSEEITNTKILSTLAKYLWMKDNLEFRLRVIAAIGFLVGAKVSKNCELCLFLLIVPLMFF